tara:strand:- start:2780 stop:3046 length:267 start_codon:yes stop_codon:yes gene_type:complete
MKEWIVVKFTGLSVSAKAGDVTVWADHGDIVFDSPAYEVVARCKTFKEAQFLARHERLHAKYSGKTEIVKQIAEQRGWDIYEIKLETA